MLRPGVGNRWAGYVKVLCPPNVCITRCEKSFVGRVCSLRCAFIANLGRCMLYFSIVYISKTIGLLEGLQETPYERNKHKKTRVITATNPTKSLAHEYRQQRGQTVRQRHLDRETGRQAAGRISPLTSSPKHTFPSFLYFPTSLPCQSLI